jgi:hypothetical protein
MGCDHQNLLFNSEIRWLSRGKIPRRLYEHRKEFELFLIDKKSDLSRYFQDIVKCIYNVEAVMLVLLTGGFMKPAVEMVSGDVICMCRL